MLGRGKKTSSSREAAFIRPQIIKVMIRWLWSQIIITCAQKKGVFEISLAKVKELEFINWIWWKESQQRCLDVNGLVVKEKCLIDHVSNREVFIRLNNEGHDKGTFAHVEWNVITCAQSRRTSFEIPALKSEKTSKVHK